MSLPNQRSRKKTSSSEREDEAVDEASLTTVEQAASLIKQEIFSGRFAPGQRLKIADLSNQFGFSPMPLREALRQLEGQGLIEIEPNRGAIVRRLDRKFVEDIFDLSGELRVMSLKRALAAMTFERLERLEALAQAYEDAVSEGDLEKGLKANRSFHSLIVETGGNQEVLRVFQWCWELISAFRRRFGYGFDRQRRLAQEKRMLIEAIRRQDVQMGEAILRMQNAAAVEDMLNRFTAADPEFNQ